MRSLRLIFKELLDPNLKADIPSPWEAASVLKNYLTQKWEEFVAYTIEVKKAQNDFQDAIQNAGISEVSEMSTQEVLKTFTDRRELWARGISSDQPLESPYEPQNEAGASPPAP